MPKLILQTNFTSKSLFQTLPSRLPYYYKEKKTHTQKRTRTLIFLSAGFFFSENKS